MEVENNSQSTVRRRGSQGVESNDSSPSGTPITGPVPQAKGKGHVGALNTDRLTQPETFLDDITPIEPRKGDPELPRDSHDLSLDIFRYSVVDNMLQSLEAMPHGSAAYRAAPGLYSKYNDDDDFYADSIRYTTGQNPRPRGHTYNSSHSSDTYDLRLHDTPTMHYQSNHSRIRTSSSSNFPTGLYRREGHRNGYDQEPIDSELHGRTTPSEGRSMFHKRGGTKKSSKSSVGSSMDYGYSQVLSSTRRGHGSRTGSVDQGLNRASPTREASASSILNRGRPTVTGHSAFEAAPEPTVPHGPRRPSHSKTPSYSPFPPQSSYGSPSFGPVLSPGFLRSDGANTVPNTPALYNPTYDTANAAIRAQAMEFVNATSPRDLPPLPALQQQPLVPSSGTTKVHTPKPAPQKERPGFFRRVFGSSKGQSSTNHSSNLMSPPLNTVDINTLDVSAWKAQSQHIASQLKALPDVPSHEVPDPLRDPPPAPPSLAKKPSSFFRRKRKGSVSNNAKPPVSLPYQLPPNPPSTENNLEAAISPNRSSLLQAMSPYLRKDTTSYFGDHHVDNAGLQANILSVSDVTASMEPLAFDGTHFSPEHMPYSPHMDAPARAVDPDRRGSANTENAPPSRGEAVMATPGRISEPNIHADSPKLKIKMRKKSASPTKAVTDDSFLADSSGNEDKSGRASPSLVYEFPATPACNATKGPQANLAVTNIATPVQKRSPGAESKESITPRPKANIGEKRTESFACSQANPSPLDTAAARNHTKDLLLEPDDDDWVITTKLDELSVKSPSTRDWVRLEPSPAEERRAAGESYADETPISPESVDDIFHSATSLPILQVESNDTCDSEALNVLDAVRAADAEPTSADREKADLLFNGDESLVNKTDAAGWLGGSNAEVARVRKAYMQLFEWNGCSIIFALRELCGKLTMIAEAQQLDRIIDSFSRRWCECNPNHGFKADDAVHSICYAAFLLNTDLHRADHDTRMTKGQFVRNTMPTVKRIVADAAPESLDDSSRYNTLRGPRPDSAAVTPTSPLFPHDIMSYMDDRPSTDNRAQNRMSARPPPRSNSDGPLGHYDTADSSILLVRGPGLGKNWETQLEIVLKDIYTSISRQPLPLLGVQAASAHDQPHTNSLSVHTMLRRTPSVLSKAPSEAMSYRARLNSGSSRWTSKGRRPRPSVYPASTVGSSRTSFDDSSIWTPVASSTWSKYSLGKSQSGMSVDSLGSRFASGEYSQSIGFANALNNVMVREESTTTSPDFEDISRMQLLYDDSLGLEGAPWAKEGMLKYKYHLEAPDKKAKKGDWTECFAVVEKGSLKLFSFATPSKSLRQKAKKTVPGATVGGGNWAENASVIAAFPLRHTLASSLPPPGYSRSRPYVWALNMPNGALHLFQVNTEEIIKEFVSTANFWAARMSKEPLMGGVSNIEYGWSDKIIGEALSGRLEMRSPTPTINERPMSSRTGVYSSGRGSISGTIAEHTGSMKAKLPGDRVTIADWSPPSQTLMASDLTGEDQLKHLKGYVQSVEDDLSKHNELRHAMDVSFSHKHSNYFKAMANWEKKSAYLLKEIVKFKTYVDSLTEAQTAKDRVYAARKEKNGDDADTSLQNKTQANLSGQEVPSVKVDFDDPFPNAQKDRPAAAFA